MTHIVWNKITFWYNHAYISIYYLVHYNFLLWATWTKYKFIFISYTYDSFFR